MNRNVEGLERIRRKNRQFDRTDNEVRKNKRRWKKKRRKKKRRKKKRRKRKWNQWAADS